MDENNGSLVLAFGREETSAPMLLPMANADDNFTLPIYVNVYDSEMTATTVKMLVQVSDSKISTL